MAAMYDARESLLRELGAARVVFVVGAGFSVASTDLDAAASWSDLVAHGVSFASAIRALGSEDTRRIETLAENRTSAGLIAAASELEKKLRGVPSGFDIWMAESVGRFRVAHPELRDALRALNVTIATTNYDTLLSEDGGPPPIAWTDGPRSLKVLRGDLDGILHLHGVHDVPDSIVFGDAGYDTVRADQFAQFRQQVLAAVRTLVFVGCGEGLHDPNLASLLDWLSSLRVQHAHYRLVRSVERSTQPQANIIDVVYGDDFGDLAPFLERLAVDAAAIGAPRGGETPESVRAAQLTSLGPIGERLKVSGRLEKLGQYVDAFMEVSTALDEALSLPDADPMREELVARVRAECAGLILRVDGDAEEAFEMVSLALNTGFMRSNARARFYALLTRAESGIVARRISEARAALNAAALSAESDNDRLHILQVEAQLCMATEDYAEAAASWATAAEQFRTAQAVADDDVEATRTTRGLALCLHNRGLALGRNGDLVGACRELQDAATCFSTISVPEDEVPCLYFLAEYQLRSGLFEQGFDHVDRAITEAAAHHLDVWEMKAHELRARAFYTRDKDHGRDVLRSLYAASQVAQRIGDEDTIRRCLQMTATVYAENNQFDVALHYLEGAAVAARSSGDPLAIADVAKQVEEVTAKQPRPWSEESRRRYFASSMEALSRTLEPAELAAAGKQIRSVIWPDDPDTPEVDPAYIDRGDPDRDAKAEVDLAPTLRAKLEASATDAEAARIMMQLGGWYLHLPDPYEAGLWFGRAHEAATSANRAKLVASALVGQVVVALTDDNYDATREMAKLDEAAQALGQLRDPEIEAAIAFHRGRLLAGESRFDQALGWFRRARDVAKRVHEDRMTDDADDWIRRIEAHLQLLGPAQLSFGELAEELAGLEAWYPEEREALRKFWYYCRDEDIMKNASAVGGVTKCLVMAHSNTELDALRGGLSGLFDLIFYSSDTPFARDFDDMGTEIVPFPADRPLPLCVNVIGVPVKSSDASKEASSDAATE